MKRLVILLMLLSGRAFAITYPLHVSADSTKILDASNAALYLNGYAAWMITRLDSASVGVLFDSLQAKGFNAAFFQMIDAEGMHDNRCGAACGDSIVNYYGKNPFTPYDPTACTALFSSANAPDTTYWNYNEYIVDQANSRGIILFVYPTYAGWSCVDNCTANQGMCRALIAADDSCLTNYGVFLGNRFKDHPNLVWVNGGDTNPATNGILDELDLVAQGIASVDSTHLHTAHGYPELSSWDQYKKPWLKLNGTYSANSGVPGRLRTDYLRTNPKIPFYYLEGKYETGFAPSGAQVMRRQAWWALLGGAQGHFYGHERVWEFPLKVRLLNATNWFDSLNTKGTRGIVQLDNWRKAHPWETLVPDYGHTFVTAGWGALDSTYVASALTTSRKFGAVYLPKKRTITVDMSRFTGNPVYGWWFNPSTGDSTSAGSYTNVGTQTFTPATGRDWVLSLWVANIRVRAAVRP